MRTINYKSDFSIIEKFKCKDYKLVPFRFTYYTKSINYPYIAEYRIENSPEFTNCVILPNGNIKVVFQEHNLGAGYLKVKREFFIPDDSFEDGICHHISEEDLDISLEKGVPNDETDKIFDTEIQAYYVTLEVGNSDDFSRDSKGNLIISNKFKNSKQDRIDDLNTIRANANKGATALQFVPSEYITETELNNKNYSTKTYVDNKIADLVDSAPEDLNTLKELAEALNDNKDIVDVLNESISKKQDKINAMSQSDFDSLDTFIEGGFYAIYE